MRRFGVTSWRVLVAGGLALLVVLVIVLAGSGWLPTGTTYYVSKAGSNGEGTDWETAWSELDQIDWAVVRPGDTVLVDGGAHQMVYETSLAVQRSGVKRAPITIKLASEPGRNGNAVIFGGRTTPLPYCGQQDYAGGSQRDYGIDLQGQTWIVVDGTKWRGITIHGSRWGIIFSGTSADITVRNVEVYDTGGWQIQDDGTYQPWDEGVEIAGSRIALERMLIYDNGQDAIQDRGEGVRDFTLRDSWLYNTRQDPHGNIWNYCSHPDGIQIWGGGEQYGITVENSIIGPGFMQGMLLGDVQAVVHNVRVRNSLFYGNRNANIMSHPNQPAPSRNWRIENVTSDRPLGDRWTNIGFQWEGGFGAPRDIAIRNSIFTGGYGMWLPETGHYRGNVQWNVGGPRVGEVANPEYANPDSYGSLGADADFRLAPDSPAAGRGSGITSARSLLGR